MRAAFHDTAFFEHNNFIGILYGRKAMSDHQRRPAARRFVDFTLSPEAQNINAKLKINSIPSNRNTTLSPDAPNFSEMKLIDYDTPRWGSPAERSRLLKKFDAEVKSQPR